MPDGFVLQDTFMLVEAKQDLSPEALVQPNPDAVPCMHYSSMGCGSRCSAAYPDLPPLMIGMIVHVHTHDKLSTACGVPGISKFAAGLM